MTAFNQIATVFGGTGFLGRLVVRELARLGYRIKIATRIPESAYFLRPAGSVGQIVPVACDYSDPKSIREAVKGASVVVNTTGILIERRRGDFGQVHAMAPELIARACTREGVKRFVHVSALGVDRASSRYAHTKLEGERRVRQAFPDATILRPSIMFGPEDHFFNRFAELARYLPALPLIGGKTKFQPVYVGDVADAVLKCVTLPTGGKDDPRGRIYQLGGPEIVTFRQIYERLFAHTGRRRALVSLPFGLARLQAAFLSLLPAPLLTPDQVESLKTDNIVAPQSMTLHTLGITPTAMDTILPTYLDRFRPGGKIVATLLTVLALASAYATPGIPSATAQTRSIAAVVNDDAVSMSDVEDRIKLILGSSSLPDNAEMRAKVTPQVLNMLIDEKLKMQEAKKMKLSVPEEEVMKGLGMIAAQNNLQPEQFREILKQQGIPERTLLDQIRSQMVWGQVVQARLRPQIEITENDIDAQMARLRANIGTTEYRLAEIFLPVDSKKDENAVRQLADKLSAQLKQGAPFPRVAAQFSQSASAAKGGDMGWIQQSQLPETVADAVKGMKKESLSDPIRSVTGYHIVFLRDMRTIAEANIPNRDQLTNQIGLERLERLQRRFLFDLKASAFIERRV